MSYYRRNTCGICGSTALQQIVDLGSMPPANAFIDPGTTEEISYPLTLAFCSNCSLVQLVDVVDPHVLFHDYHYVTSASNPLVDHFIALGKEIISKYIDSKDDLVIDIGGNDGVLLASIMKRCRVLNVEPVSRIAEISKKKGVQTLNAFFNKKESGNIVSHHGTAAVVTASNVFAHIDNIKGIFEGVRDLLSQDGVFILEVHWVGNLVGEGGFDQIYHEHLCYYSLHSLKYLLDDTAMSIFDVKLIPIHGQSLQVHICRDGRKPHPRVADFLKMEKDSPQGDLTSIDTFTDFQTRIVKLKKDLNRTLTDLKSKGKKIVGYGAPGKGNTLLCYCGIDRRILDVITDTTPFKQGKLTPGTRIPIVHPDTLKTNRPDHILLLSWNYADAILEKEKGLRDKGVKFIIPIPRVRII